LLITAFAAPDHTLRRILDGNDKFSWSPTMSPLSHPVPLEHQLHTVNNWGKNDNDAPIKDLEKIDTLLKN